MQKKEGKNTRTEIQTNFVGVSLIDIWIFVSGSGDWAFIRLYFTGNFYHVFVASFWNFLFAKQLL